MTHEEYESKSQMKRVEILKAGEKQMNHEELLAKITNGNISYKAENKALRAVVELHKPNIKGGCDICSWIIGGFVLYKVCPTIQAIEKELA